MRPMSLRGSRESALNFTKVFVLSSNRLNVPIHVPNHSVPDDLIDGADVTDTRASRTSRIIPVVDELLRRWIKAAETVNLPHPQPAASILIDAQNVVGKQAVGIAGLVAVFLKCPLRSSNRTRPLSQPPNQR